MPQDTEVVQRWMWAFENDTDAFREVLHPELEWFPFEENHSPSHGVEGGMRIRNQWMETWDEHQVDIEELVERGDSIVASCHVMARGKGSGVEVDTHLYVQFKVRDEKIVYIYEHESKAAALEAAREQVKERK